MRLGCRLVSSALGLTLVAAPTLTGCGLLDRGSTVEEAFEYLPADTFSFRFADRAAASERLDDDEAVAITDLGRFASAMEDAPLNAFDVEWEASAAWGDPTEPDGVAHVWKVGDDVDFDALAEDLEDKGYDEDGSRELPVYAADRSAIDDVGLVGGVYPPQLMLNVMLDEDEQLVVGATSVGPLDDIGDVTADDADSLADDGGMDDLLDAAEGDVELALLTAGGPTLCASTGRPLPEQVREQYDDLGRPEARALFISGDDPEALLALQFESEDAAVDDLEAREALIEDGADIYTRQSFDDLGDFDLERDGSFVLIEEDFESGTAQAIQVEKQGGGPGFCLPDPD